MNRLSKTALICFLMNELPDDSNFLVTEYFDEETQERYFTIKQSYFDNNDDAEFYENAAAIIRKNESAKNVEQVKTLLSKTKKIKKTH
jgi:hypothetical protein